MNSKQERKKTFFSFCSSFDSVLAFASSKWVSSHCFVVALFLLCFGCRGNDSKRGQSDSDSVELRFGEGVAEDSEREVPTGPDPLHHHYDPKVRP
ncbi:hypothetical protein CDL15_Pgr026577 [Punica granatum]|uniref:Uncharacterized protein n=1 Tax=Punica granatum TaxID=22663 RepID=A0A218WLW6_PUNGR|nr:hypothetical protein CDL15_Pgr026577 [Punica granatum]